MSILSNAASSATYNMFLQVSYRMLTFAMNAFIIRYVSHNTLGIINVRLMLLYSTILFITREGYRRACSKTPETKEKLAAIVNILWTIPIVGAVVSSVLAFVWIYLLSLHDAKVDNYSLAVVVYCIASFVELLVEPLFIVGQMFMCVKLKVAVEACMLFSRCFVTILLLTLVDLQPILIFSFAMMYSTGIYALGYTFYMARYARHQIPLVTSYRDLLPSFMRKEPRDVETTSIICSFMRQSVIKQLLTESEKFAMTLCSVLSFKDQGVYDIISNLGSLAARFIFLPLEDASYLYFSQSLTRGQDKTDKEDPQAPRVLGYLLKIVSTVGLIFLVFGYNYSFLLLNLYGGTALSSAQGVLLMQTYCVFVLLLAVNGITECFMFATMDKQQIDNYNYNMFYLSVSLLVASWYLTSCLGSIGLLLANAINMAIRIYFSTRYIRHYYGNSEVTPLAALKVKKPLLVTLCFSFVVTFISRVYLCTVHSSILHRGIHVLIGAGCLLFVMFAVYISERDLYAFARQQIKKKKT